jgi:hypothetical protein
MPMKSLALSTSRTNFSCSAWARAPKPHAQGIVAPERGRAIAHQALQLVPCVLDQGLRALALAAVLDDPAKAEQAALGTLAGHIQHGGERGSVRALHLRLPSMHLGPGAQRKQ